MENGVGGTVSLFTYPVAFYLMFARSGDNTASSMSLVVGSGVRSFWGAILIIAVFGTLGAVLQGSAVEDTRGGGIILDAIPGYAAVIIVLPRPNRVRVFSWGSCRSPPRTP